MEGQARSALLVARSARNQQVSPSKILFNNDRRTGHQIKKNRAGWIRRIQQKNSARITLFIQIEDSGANPKVIFPPRSQFQVLPLLNSVERGAAEA